jgi:hypothetical protein
VAGGAEGTALWAMRDHRARDGGGGGTGGGAPFPESLEDCRRGGEVSMVLGFPMRPLGALEGGPLEGVDFNMGGLITPILHGCGLSCCSMNRLVELAS